MVPLGKEPYCTTLGRHACCVLAQTDGRSFRPWPSQKCHALEYIVDPQQFACEPCPRGAIFDSLCTLHTIDSDGLDRRRARWEPQPDGRYAPISKRKPTFQCALYQGCGILSLIIR